MLEIQENVWLAPYTTLKVGGPAAFLARPTTQEAVIEALQWAQARSLPVFVIGGGSNLLVSDRGFPGLVLHMSISGIVSRSEDGKQIYSAGAGVVWDELAARAVADDCAGVECLSGIPGTVGGTPIQNVGAYGQDVAETIHCVRAVDTASGQPVIFSSSACEFSYRRSRFNQRDRGRYIITQVDYGLEPGGPPKLAYADLRRHFAESQEIPTLAEAREAVLAIRRAKGMVLDENDADSRSAGSFFQNPVVTRAQYERVAGASSLPVPHFEAADGQLKLAAAWLIEQSGIAKGFVLGSVAISSKHTLALTNRGGATAADVILLKEYVQRRVFQRFGIELHPEPVMLGF